PEAAQPLIEALRGPEQQVRAAATALGEIGGGPAIRALATSLWDSTGLVQSEAAAALLRIGPAAIPALAPGLQSSDPQVCQIPRWMLVMLTGQPLAEGPAAPVPPEEAPDVTTQAPDVRDMPPEAALAALQRLDEDEAEHAPEVFRRALGHPGPRVRSQALAYLNDLGEPPLDDDEKRLRALIDGDWDTIESLGPGPLGEILIAQLRTGDRYDRKEAVEGLGKLRDGRSTETLLEALGDAEEDVRGLAVRALAALREERAV